MFDGSKFSSVCLTVQWSDTLVFILAVQCSNVTVFKEASFDLFVAISLALPSISFVLSNVAPSLDLIETTSLAAVLLTLWVFRKNLLSRQRTNIIADDAVTSTNMRRPLLPDAFTGKDDSRSFACSSATGLGFLLLLDIVLAPARTGNPEISSGQMDAYQQYQQRS